MLRAETAPRARSCRRLAPIVLAVSCLALAGPSAAARLVAPSTPATAARFTPRLHTAASAGGAMVAATRPAPVGVTPALAVSASAPTRVVISRIGVDSALERLPLLADGTIAAPTDYAVAGWFAAGPLPGRPGPAVIAGHVDSRTGPGVFARLDQLRVGDRVEVVAGDGTALAFRVTGSSLVEKDQFPAASVYGPVPDAELRLITCGGSFDDQTGHYRSNVVVDAVLTTPAPTPTP